ITVLLSSPHDWDGPAGRRVIEHLSLGFALLPNVAEVRSLTQPLGRPVEDLPPPPPTRKTIRGSLFTAVWSKRTQGLPGDVTRQSRAFYVAKVRGEEGQATRHITRLDVVLHSDPFDPRSAATLETVQLWLHQELPGLARGLGTVRAETYGVTVSSRDLAQV